MLLTLNKGMVLAVNQTNSSSKIASKPGSARPEFFATISVLWLEGINKVVVSKTLMNVSCQKN